MYRTPLFSCWLPLLPFCFAHTGNVISMIFAWMELVGKFRQAAAYAKINPVSAILQRTAPSHATKFQTWSWRPPDWTPLSIPKGVYSTRNLRGRTSILNSFWRPGLASGKPKWLWAYNHEYPDDDAGDRTVSRERQFVTLIMNRASWEALSSSIYAMNHRLRLFVWQ